MRNERPSQIRPHTPKLRSASSLLFVGVLLFATLVVPGIALTTQWVMDVEASEQSKSQAQTDRPGAAGQESLGLNRQTGMVHGETGSSGRQCSAGSSLGADSIFTGLCSETAN